MTTATKNVLAELEKLERDRDEKQAHHRELRDKRNEWDRELQIKRTQLSATTRIAPITGRYSQVEPDAEQEKLSKEVKRLMREGNPFEDERQAALADFHEADVRWLKFKVANAREIVDGIAPDREKVATELEAAVEQFSFAIDNYRMSEAATMQAAGIVGLPGKDVLVDNRVAQLASVIASLDLADITPPHSWTLHSNQPLYRPSEDGTGWVS